MTSGARSGSTGGNGESQTTDPRRQTARALCIRREHDIRSLPPNAGAGGKGLRRWRKPAERSAEGAEPLYLIPRKQVGIWEGERRRPGRWEKVWPAKRQARARAASARWEKYARQQSDLVESLRKIKRHYFRRLADQVEQCHRLFRGSRCGNGHTWAKPAFSCKCRLCPFEMRARSMAAQHKFGSLIAGLREPKYLTLSMKNCPLAELRQGIDDLFSAFGRLRHSKTWAEVRGALAVLEVTFNETAKTWHPHLNVIFDGPFISKAQLDEAWLRSTEGRGCITWIKCADRRTVPELLKYITKVADFIDNPDAVAWFLRATRGKRFIRTYGSLYRLKLDELDSQGQDEGQGACPDCGCREVSVFSVSLRRHDVHFDDSGILRCRPRVNASPPFHEVRRCRSFVRDG